MEKEKRVEKEILSQGERQRITQKLSKKIENPQCPMCRCRQFILADVYFNHSLQADSKNMSIGGASIPTIAIICSKCGFVSQHAIGVLELLNQ
jgi:hypothetical protein